MKDQRSKMTGAGEAISMVWSSTTLSDGAPRRHRCGPIARLLGEDIATTNVPTPLDARALTRLGRSATGLGRRRRADQP